MFKAIAETPKGKDRQGRDLDEEYGGISAFKASTISAASRVGTGNIAGVALAISIGGPGAVFFHRDMLPELKNVEFWDGSDPVTRRSVEDRVIARDAKAAGGDNDLGGLEGGFKING